MVASILEYAALAILYSLLAAVVVESLLSLWHVQDPPLAVRFRVLILAIPPVAPLLFSALEPNRSAESFRHAALLDLHNWLGPYPTLLSPGWMLLAATIVATSSILIGPEATGFLRHRLMRRKGENPLPAPTPTLLSALERLAAKGLGSVNVKVVDQPVPIAYTAGLVRPVVLVSTRLTEVLDDQELEAVVAHEIVHVRRRDNWLGWLIFALRLVSFYNPVALFTFHQISHDTERICDAEAAAATGHPLALASALIKVYLVSHARKRSQQWFKPVSWSPMALEDRARRTLVEDRARRLVHTEAVRSSSYPLLRLALGVVGILGLAYFVV